MGADVRRAGGGGGAGTAGARPPGYGTAALVVAAVLWGSSFVLTRVALGEVSVSHLIVLRFGIAVAALAPVLLHGPLPRRADLPALALVGIVGVPGIYLPQVAGVERVGAATAALVLGCLPPLVAAAAVWSGRETGARVPWGPLLLSAAGALVLAGAPSAGGDWTGAALVCLSALATVAWILLGKPLLERYGSARATAWSLLVGTAALLPLSLAMDGVPPLALSLRAWGAVLGLGLGCTAAAYLLWGWGLRRTSASRAAVFANLEPLVGAGLAAAVLGERVGPGAWAGGALILLAALAVSASRDGGETRRGGTTRGLALPRPGRTMTARRSAVFAALAVVASPISAMAQTSGVLCGRASSAEGTALPAVAVQVDGGRGVLTDADGRFCIPGLLPGQVRIEARRLDLAPLGRTVTVVAGETAEVQLRMAATALAIPAVVVTAREGSDDAGSTVSRLERSAIDHLQASSLGDVLQLLPGQTAENPTTAGAQQSLLRQAPGPADASRANALGTSVVMDGVPLSNNANLQTDVTILNSGPGALPAFSSVAGRGTDLRQVSADEIESVEVVRGVPSARHGELTAGAILVETRAGARRPEARLRMNPTTVEGSWGAGWGNGLTGNGWSASTTLLRAQDDPRETEGRFGRGTLHLGWTRPFAAGRGSSTLRLSGWSTLDETRRDPDDFRYQRAIRSRDRGVRATASGRWRAAPDGGLRLTWTAAASYAEQASSHQELVTRSDLFPLSPATRDTTLVGTFGRTEYLSRLEVDGRPLNLYGRLEAARGFASAGVAHGAVAGVEWRYDANLGDGRRFDPAAPPRQNYSVGDRPRSFRDVPGLPILSAYVEDRASARVGGRAVEVQAGLRFDNIAPESPVRGRFGAVLAPRLNVEAELTPALRIRAAYGVTAKAPPLAYLYPGPRFFDLVNFSHYAADPAERLVVVTTRRVDPSNEGARAFRTTKREMGLAWDGAGVQASAVLFDERTRGAYGWTRYVAAFPVEKYGVLSQAPGAPPVLAPEPVAVDTFLGAYDAPAATRRIDSRGAELTIDLPEWSPLRTTATLNGGWVRTRSADGAREVDTGALFRGAQAPPRIAIRGTEGYLGERLVTGLRLVHRAPEAGMVVSALVQTIWREHDRRMDVSADPIGYVTRDGRTVLLSPDEALRPEYDDLRRPVSDEYLLQERRPALWLVNLRVSKALPAGLQMSFYVNNLLADRPLYLQRRSGGYEQRNPPLFFGVELVSSL